MSEAPWETGLVIAKIVEQRVEHWDLDSFKQCAHLSPRNYFFLYNTVSCQYISFFLFWYPQSIIT